jgi:hypothetical protein
VNIARLVTLTATYGSNSAQGSLVVSPPTPYPLTTAVSPPGKGTVSPSSGAYGGSVTFTATPISGYQFTGFNANGIEYSTNPAIIPMTAATTVTATFAPASVTPPVLADGAPQPTVWTNDPAVSAVYQFSFGDPTRIDHCTTTDPANVTATLGAVVGNALTINFTANASAARGFLPVSCHWGVAGGEGGIGLPPTRVRRRSIVANNESPGDGDDGGLPGLNCPGLSQNFTAPNNGQPVTWTYYVINGDASLVQNCHFSNSYGVADNSVAIQGITYPSQRTTCGAALDVTMAAAAGATLGARASLDCQYSGASSLAWTGGTALTVVDGTPAITSISPTYAIAGATQDITITGSRLDAVTSVNISGHGCPGSGCALTAALTGVSSTSVTAHLSIAANAPSGDYYISVNAYGATSNSVPFMIGDSSPVINYLTQQPLQSGQQGSASIYGSHFGTGCSNLPCTGAHIAVCRSSDATCTSSDVTPAVTYWSDTQINANLNADTSASGSYDVQVTSAGAAGLGWAPAPTPVGPTCQTSNRKAIAVNGNPNVTLRLMSGTQVVPAITDGNRTTTASCAWIDETPTMPNIAVKVVNADGSSAPGKANYQLVTLWDWINRDAITQAKWTEPANHYVPAASRAQADAGTLWTVPWPSNCGLYAMGSCFFGGYATMYWSYSPDGQQAAQEQPPYSFYICGKNPPFSAALQSLSTVMSNPTQYWFAEKLAWHETGLSQFCESGRMDREYCSPGNNHMGWPVLGKPAGYGLLQRDPLPTTGGWEMPSQIMWNWQEAITSGKAEIDATAGPYQYSADRHAPAYGFWMSQVRQWNAYNALRAASDRVPPPADRNETSSCTFTLPLNHAWDANRDSVGLETPVFIPLLIPSNQQPHFTAWFGDANLIKRFNGAPVDYMVWQNSPERSPVPFWQYTPGNSTSGNTVREVCSCFGDPKNCMATIPPQ